MSYTESNYENAIIQLFEEMGYTHLYGPDIDRDYKIPLHIDELTEALYRLNPKLPEDAITDPSTPVALGKFDYLGQADGANYVFVLLKHIYAGLHFKASIDPEYHKLRDIKVRKVELTATDIPPQGDLTVTITANNEGTDPLTSVSFVPDATLTDDATITLYDDSEGHLLPEPDVNIIIDRVRQIGRAHV